MSAQQNTEQRTDSHNGQGWFSGNAVNSKPANTEHTDALSVEQDFDGTMKDIVRLLGAAASPNNSKSTTILDGKNAQRTEMLHDGQTCHAEGMKACSDYRDAAQTQMINKSSAAPVPSVDTVRTTSFAFGS